MAKENAVRDDNNVTSLLGENSGETKLIKANIDGRIKSEEISPNKIIRDLIFNNKLDNPTFAVGVSIGDTTFTVNAGHNIVAGNQLSVQEGQRGFQALVLSVSTNDITIDTPFDFAYTTSASISRSNNNMKTESGSLSSPVLFNIGPIQQEIIDVTKIIFFIKSTSAMDDDKFGSETALTNGIVIRSKQNSIYNNLINFKNNGDLSLRVFDTKYVSKTGGGLHSYTANIAFGGESNDGSIIRLDGSTGDGLEILIQDDLNALLNITEIRATLHGRISPD